MHTTDDHRWRRAAGAVLAAAVAVLIVATPVIAAVTHQVESPANGSLLSGPTDVRVATQRELLDPPVKQVDVRLSSDGQTTFPGSQPVNLGCVEPCEGESTQQVWAGVALDPAAPATFFPGPGAAPMCNGAWRLQPSIDGGTWATGVTVYVSRPPSAVPSLDLDPGVATVDVTWGAAPEPDVSGYRLERRQVGASFWTVLGDFSPSTRSFEDTGLGTGDYEYRVVTYRPDGRSDSGWAAACTDSDNSFSTASAPSATTVGSQPSPRPTSSPSPGGASGGTTSGGDGDTTGDGGVDGGDDGGSAGDGGTTTGGSTRRVAPPPPPSGSGPELSAPDLPRPEAAEPEEHFFGEGEAFEELLDYGDAGEDPDSDSTEELGEVEVEASGFTSVITRIFDSDRVVRFMAASLVLFTLALHVIRWMHEGDVA